MKKEWWLLFLAGALEVVWVSGLKHSTEWWHWIGTIVSIVFSFAMFIVVASKLPLGTVYVIFTGLGTAGTVIAEILLFGEPVNPLKLMLIALMGVAVLGLKLVTKDAEDNERKGEA